MNIHAGMPTTIDEFFLWNETREGKREFVNGRVVEHIRDSTRGHTRICTRLAYELGQQLGFEKFDVGTSGFAVRTSGGIRFPDVIVELRTPEAKGTDLIARHPLLIAEVLSPSSYSRDLGEKAEDYVTLPTLQNYLVFSQDEQRAWVWSRRSEAWVEPDIVSGIEGDIDLSGLRVRIGLASIYRGIA
jgi:Uma2 family endonuclease